MKRLYIPYNRKLVEKARENRKNQTEAENKIWNEILKDRQLKNYKFLRQKPLDNFIADFYCAELMLVIEVDGGYHKKEKEHDILRSERMECYGIKVVRCPNSEILFNLEKIRQRLIKEVKEREKEPILPPDKGAKGVLGGRLPPDKGVGG